MSIEVTLTQLNHCDTAVIWYFYFSVSLWLCVLLAFAAGAFIGVASLKWLDSGFVMRRGMSNNGPLKSDIASAQNDILHELDYKASDIFRPIQLCSPSDAKLSNCYNTRTSKKVLKERIGWTFSEMLLIFCTPPCSPLPLWWYLLKSYLGVVSIVRNLKASVKYVQHK